MKRLVQLWWLLVLAVPVWAGTYSVKGVKGTVEVRKDISEEWRTVRVGDLLRPEDTMRTGKKSTATIVVEGREIVIPEMTMVDLVDFREMSQEEFLLKLAMENVLSVPPRSNEKMAIPRTTVLHGSNMEKEASDAAIVRAGGPMILKGARLLFQNGFYATCILKTKETLRLYPDLKSDYDARLTVATGFERMQLYSEALTEYARIAQENPPPTIATKVHSSLDRLKKLQQAN